MGRLLRKPQASTRGARISRHLALVVILVVVAGVSIVGLPALGLIWHQLEEQALLQVQSAQAATQTLYAAEGRRLEELAALVARDPTLGELIQRRDRAELTTYLDDLQQSLSVDALIVLTTDEQRFGHPYAQTLPANALISNHDMPFVDFVTLDDPLQMLYVAVSEVYPRGEQNPVGWVVTARVLDDDFMQTLAQQTGLAQNLIINGRRVSTSLGNSPDWPLDSAVASPMLDAEMYCCVSGVADGERYDIGYVPLTDSQGTVVAFSEDALPIGAIRAGRARIIALLLAAGLGVAVGASTLVILLTRRITHPLHRLVEEATRMGSGDLETPIASDDNLWEINQLARELDRARRRLRHTYLATQREKKHIEHLLGAIREGVVAIDEDGHVTFFSADAERILGYKANRVLQMPCKEIFRPAPGEIVTVGEMLRQPEGAPPLQHLTVLDAKDHPVDLAVSISWLDSETSNGLRRERVLVLRDVTEEEVLERLRCDFLANVAHEFRTPLSAVIATTELLTTENDTLIPDEFTELANMIRMSTMRLRALIDNLLESASIEAGCFRVRCRPTTFQDVIDNVVETMTPILRRRKQPLEIEAPDDLPTLWADPERLSQGLINLLANASRFGPMGIPITLSARRDDDTLTVAVLDSGPGLPTGRISDLFLRFVTGDQPIGAQYGIGLGLSVTKAIIEAHGGHIGAENRDEGGAKVWFTLPLRSQERD